MRRKRNARLFAAMLAASWLASGALREPHVPRARALPMVVKADDPTCTNVVVVFSGWRSDGWAATRPMFKALTAVANLIVVNYPESGQSFELTALFDEIVSIIACNGYDNIGVLGRSMGAQVGIAFGQRLNELWAERLPFLVAAYPLGDSSTLWVPRWLLQLGRWVRLPVGSDAVSKLIGRWVAAYSPYPQEGGVDPVMLQANVACIWSTPVSAMVAQAAYMGSLRHRADEQPKWFRAVVVVDGGEHGADPLIDAAAAFKQMRQSFPEVTRITLCDYPGHDMTGNYPRAMANILVEQFSQ